MGDVFFGICFFADLDILILELVWEVFFSVCKWIITSPQHSSGSFFPFVVQKKFKSLRAKKSESQT